MSEPIPESIPTSADPRSKRPLKKARPTTGSNAAAARQSHALEALFANPDRDIKIPDSAVAGPKMLSAPPEIVANVQGSSAGAGSGEFHVYKASRRREYERLRAMDLEKAREDGDKEFEARRAEIARRDEEKREKNRAKRRKAKEKGKGGGGKSGNGLSSSTNGKVDLAAGRLVDDGEADRATEGEAVIQEEIGITIHDDD